MVKKTEKVFYIKIEKNRIDISNEKPREAPKPYLVLGKDGTDIVPLAKEPKIKTIKSYVLE